jgi:hypothetical protein
MKAIATAVAFFGALQQFFFEEGDDSNTAVTFFGSLQPKKKQEGDGNNCRCLFWFVTA